MIDLQNCTDLRKIKINEVGVEDFTLPIRIRCKDGHEQSVVANFRVSVELLESVRGTHMSRFIEILEEYKNSVYDYDMILTVLSDIKKKLKTNFVFLEVSFDFFMEKKSPVKKIVSTTNYKCKLKGKINENDEAHVSLNARVPVLTVCPCSKAISKEGAHNQRGIIEVCLEYNGMFYLDEIILNIEKNGGSFETYSAIKRVDEKYITEKMFSNPKFVEDVIRDTIIGLNRINNLKILSLKCKNYESIHNHNVYTKIVKNG